MRIDIDIGLIANGKLNDEFTCKTEDGRSKLLFYFIVFFNKNAFFCLVGIPINGKYRLGTNPCKGKKILFILNRS